MSIQFKVVAPAFRDFYSKREYANRMAEPEAQRGAEHRRSPPVVLSTGERTVAGKQA